MDKFCEMCGRTLKIRSVSKVYDTPIGFICGTCYKKNRINLWKIDGLKTYYEKRRE